MRQPCLPLNHHYGPSESAAKFQKRAELDLAARRVVQGHHGVLRRGVQRGQLDDRLDRGKGRPSGRSAA